MNLLVKAYKTIKMHIYNRKNFTNIKSLYANLNATYGKHVLIDENTVVHDDVQIGDYSYVNKSSYIENCTIGKYCSISSHVYISPYNHNMCGLTTHPIGDVCRLREKTIIDNDVLISLNAVIMEGVHIHTGAVIGAGAIVTKDVGAYEVWGGVPAKFIHYRIQDEKQREILENLEWWNLSDDELNLYIDKYRESLDGIVCSERMS